MLPRGGLGRARSQFLRLFTVTALVASFATAAVPRAHAAPMNDPNAGTIKIRQTVNGPELKTDGNQPHVCLPFYVTGDGITGYSDGTVFTIKFFDQGGGATNGNFIGQITTASGPNPFAAGAFTTQITSANLTDASGNPSSTQLMSGGHYKVQIYDPTGTEIDKAKSKVIMVECLVALTLQQTTTPVCAGPNSVVGLEAYLYDQKNGMSSLKDATPLSGVQLTFTIVSGPGTLSSSTATTDANGHATVNVIGGDSSTTVQVTAPSYGLSSNPPTQLTYLASSLCGSTPPPPSSATPELGSGELLATGLLPVGAILLYRRRRYRRAS